jgi:4-amino-4-deoxy-L-arabinose transferase-like glycosyltransferase
MSRHRLAGLLARVPTAGWICALIACLNAVSWSLITPPFQVPDEQAHFAYVEELARTHRLPTSSTQQYAPDEVRALEDLQVGRVSLQPQHGTIATRAEQHGLERGLAAGTGASSPGVGAAGDAASEPPLYYALEAIPYELGAGGGVLDQLALMRLLSAAMAGVTALCAFLFMREALPRTPGAWTVAGLAVAFMPALGSISGAVNPEAMLCAVAAAIFYCLARAFRRGLTPCLAVVIGVLTAVGFLTKLNFLGLAPGVFLGLVVLTRRSWRVHGADRALRVLAPALGIAATPVFAYIAINLLSHHQTLGFSSHALASTARRSMLGEVNYIWQLYLPRLPGMHVDFGDISPIRDLWFDGLVGDYGFEDTFFPRWVDTLAAIPLAAILGLAAREAYMRRSALRARLAEFGLYLAMALGLLVLVGASSYLWFPDEAAGFPEPRYVLPLSTLFAAVLALAARGGGRRWGAAAGALIVVLFMAHDLFSQLQVIARYYG